MPPLRCTLQVEEHNPVVDVVDVGGDVGGLRKKDLGGGKGPSPRGATNRTTPSYKTLVRVLLLRTDLRLDLRDVAEPKYDLLDLLNAHWEYRGDVRLELVDVHKRVL